MSGRHRRCRVAVLGAATPIGQAVAAQLARGGGCDVVCVGPRRVAIPGTSWRIADLADPILARKLEAVDVVVVAHLDSNVSGQHPNGVAPTDGAAATKRTDAIFAAVEAVGIKRVVVVSTSMVLGALPDNEIPLPDDAPVRAHLSEGVVADALHAEGAAVAWAQRVDGSLCVVRHALLVGPGIDTVLTRVFEAPRLLVIGDARPLWQFTHLDDLASAVDFVIAHDVIGPVHAVCETWWDHEHLMDATGLRPLRLPEHLVVGAADRLHRIGVSPSPPAELDYLRYPWVVSGERLREAGWSPDHTTDEVVTALVEQARGNTAIAGRRLGRPDVVSLGAAGATAAMLGAAAIVRARRRQSGW